MASLPVANENEPAGIPTENQISFAIEDRLSLELVIAFVGPVGSGVTTAVEMMKNKLENNYDYHVEPIKVSDIIRDRSSEVGVELNGNLNRIDRISRYQSAGNELREKKGHQYLADRIIEKIAFLRAKNEGFLKTADGADVPLQRRCAYLIDSLKNPAEVIRLKQVYGDLFWVITVFSPHDVRERRLCAGGLDDIDARQVMKRDHEEDKSYGQRVSKTAHIADFFIRNHTDTKDPLSKAADRFLEVVFGTALHTPTFEEQGMMKAAAAAIQSACLSRQVGASIYSATGELLGVGCNDVPKARGGLYGLSGDNDNRCFKWGGSVCHNDERKNRLARSIAKSVAQDEDSDAFGAAFNAVSVSDAKNLIEFSRSVHAEMEAIVSVARSGGGSTVEGTLFTTTYPCHNCARHIVAAGITRVVFIEPYSKSLAISLHHDSISESDEANKVHFQQYEGFSPRAAIRVFSSAGLDRKSGGAFVAKNAATAKPLFPFPLDSYINSERLIVQQLSGM